MNYDIMLMAKYINIIQLIMRITQKTDIFRHKLMRQIAFKVRAWQNQQNSKRKLCKYTIRWCCH